MALLERLVTCPLQLKAKQRPQRPLKVSNFFFDYNAPRDLKLQRLVRYLNLRNFMALQQNFTDLN